MDNFSSIFQTNVRINNLDALSPDAIWPKNTEITITRIPIRKRDGFDPDKFKEFATKLKSHMVPNGIVFLICYAPIEAKWRPFEIAKMMVDAGFVHIDNIVVKKTWFPGKRSETNLVNSHEYVLHFCNGDVWKLDRLPVRQYMKIDQEISCPGNTWEIETGSLDEAYPVDLAELLIRMTDCLPGSVIFDPYCGGMGSLRAALKLGHSFFGFDPDPKQIKKYEKVVKEYNKEMSDAVKSRPSKVKKKNMIYEKSKAKSITADRQVIRKIVSDTISQMAEIVGATLGPGGRPVILERDGMSPLVTKDGVTVAKTLGMANAEANIIIESAKEICLRTAKQAGDGTTTAIVLASALTKHGLDFLENNPKYNPQRMVSELDNLYSSIIVPFLKQHAKPVKERHELINVATISANGDATIAAAAVDAVIAAGEDGQVLIEEADDVGIRVETIDGCIVTSGLKDVGSIGLAFINDRASQQAKMDNGVVFLFDGSMNDLKVPAAIQAGLEMTPMYGKPILVFAHSFSDVVLDKFAKTTKGGYTIVPVKTPRGVANSRSMFLYDMAAYTGASVVDPGNLDHYLEADNLDEAFGAFIAAKVNMFETFVTSDVDHANIEARIAELKSIMLVAPSDRERMFARAAISKLTGGVSTIWVGGGSELEAREKKARVEDAVEAVRSAIAEGIIPGGCGVHLVLSDIIARHPDHKQSWDIMIKALRAPFEMLLTNCGEDFIDIWNLLESHIVNKQEPPKFIFDANEHRIVDPEKSGILEPAKVCRVSLGNALSVASLLITLGGIVVVPRDFGLENQLALSKQAFQDMMAGGGVGQE